MAHSVLALLPSQDPLEDLSRDDRIILKFMLKRVRLIGVLFNTVVSRPTVV